jgi:phospholipase C
MRGSPWVLVSFAGALLAGCSGGQATPPPKNINLTFAQQAQLKIQHVIVIYQENWSFDALYGKYPGANGSQGASSITQLQCPVGGTADNVPLSGNPPALIVAGNPTGPWPCNWQGLSGGATDTNVRSG